MPWTWIFWTNHLQIFRKYFDGTRVSRKFFKTFPWDLSSWNLNTMKNSSTKKIIISTYFRNIVPLFLPSISLLDSLLHSYPNMQSLFSKPVPIPFGKVLLLLEWPHCGWRTLALCLNDHVDSGLSKEKVKAIKL